MAEQTKKEKLNAAVLAAPGRNTANAAEKMSRAPAARARKPANVASGKNKWKMPDNQ